MEETMAAATAMAAETLTAMETAAVTAIIKTPMLMLTAMHQRQQQGRHARDMPCGGGGGGNVGGGAGEGDGNGRGGGNSGSGRGRQWAGWAGAKDVFIFT
jgi:hypothetical protein